ncbi:MAG: hypothetical protein ACO230_06935 [Ilumatobacteraceae bacterium]
MPSERSGLVRARLSLIAVVAVVGVVPLALDRDSFPLSTYPMFSSRRSTTETVDTAVASIDGTFERLTPLQIAGTDEVIIAARTVSIAIESGTADELCREILDRVDDADRVEVITERFDALRWYEGDREPLQRTVHASCGSDTR